MSGDRYQTNKNVRYAIAEFVINTALIFVTYKVLVVQGGLEYVGIWSSLLAWTSLIRLGDVGMANATLRFVALSSSRTDARDYIDTAIVFNTVLFLSLATLGFFVLLPFVPAIVGADHSKVAADILPLMFAGFFLSNVAGVVLGGVQGLHLGFVRSRVAIAGAAVQLLATLVLAPFLHLSGLAWAQVLQHSFTLVAAWVVIRSQIALPIYHAPRFSYRSFKSMLSYSISSQIANLANGLFEPVSKILVNAVGGLHLLGIYEIAYKTVAIGRNAIVAGVNGSVPALSGMMSTDRPRARELYDRSVRLTTWGVLLLSVVVIFGAPIVSIVWLGSMNVQYWLYVAIIMVGFAVNTIGAPAYNLGVASGHQRGNLITNWTTLTILITAGSLCATLWGAIGVVAVVSACLLLNGLAIRYLNERIFQTETLRQADVPN